MPATTTSTRRSPAALFSDRARLGAPNDLGASTWLLGRVRVDVRSSRPLFVGIARTKDVDDYLRGVARTQFSVTGGDASSDRRNNGARPSGPPASKRFWAASSVGQGEQSLTWKPHSGSWRLVVMNPDGAAHVEAGVAVAARFPHLHALGLALLGTGLLLGAVAGVLLRIALRSSHA
jgi:hypothetical protein